jgi:ISXO2-like transposase domain
MAVARLPHLYRGILLLRDALAFRLLTEKYGYEHEMINHSRQEYARGDAHTNTIEAFWANVTLVTHFFELST